MVQVPLLASDLESAVDGEVALHIVPVQAPSASWGCKVARTVLLVSQLVTNQETIEKYKRCSEKTMTRAT